MNISRYYIFIPLIALLNTQAHASTTGSVGSPNIKKGQTELTARMGYSEGEESSSQDERFRSRIHLDHAFTDYYAFKLVVSQDKRKSSSLEHDGLKFENRFQFIKQKDHGFDFGVRAAYSLKDGDKKPDSAELGFYGLVPVDAYELRINQIFSHDVGQDAENGIGGETRLQVTRSISDSHRLGLESFHDYGNFADSSEFTEQSHTLGPVLKGKFLGNYSYEAGYRVGVSDAAPDHNFKFFLNRSF